MKNKQSKNTPARSVSAYNKVNKQDEQDNKQAYECRDNRKNITKSQINRLKKFNNTTRWLPNSAFTTFFGKPAFENYGYGNTKPVYGGLFYGNYMLSHNINPIDGENVPSEKQVYASAMLKASQSKKPRIPSPPRKVPDEIRNTPDELEEIKGRNPIFQKSNNFSNREISKPNLIKAKYFRSPKGTPNKKGTKEELNDNEEFDINYLLNGKGEVKKKNIIINSQADSNFFAKNVKKKPLKEQIDNKNPDYLKAINKLQSKSNKNINYVQSDSPVKIIENERKDENNEQRQEDEKLKEYYLKMLEDKEDKDENKGNKDKTIDNTLLGQNSTLNETTHNNATKSNKITKKENPCLLSNKELK